MRISRRGFYFLMAGAAVFAGCASSGSLETQGQVTYAGGLPLVPLAAVKSVLMTTPELQDPSTAVQRKKMDLVLELQKAFRASDVPCELVVLKDGEPQDPAPSAKSHGAGSPSHLARLTLWNAVPGIDPGDIRRITVRVELFNAAQPGDVIWKYMGYVEPGTRGSDKNVADSVVRQLVRDGLLSRWL